MVAQKRSLHKVSFPCFQGVEPSLTTVKRYRSFTTNESDDEELKSVLKLSVWETTNRVRLTDLHRIVFISERKFDSIKHEIDLS